ncbi:MAG: methyltransferase domain-containing protein [Deltaproteobacteria bacterium]|nr:methyltransferase domain-containing protein [Deltaproteobacteria bacterium]
MPTLAGTLRRTRHLAALARGAARRRAVAKRLRGLARPYNLNVGCGDVRVPDFLGIDANPRARAVDLVWDATLPLPLPHGSCARVYSEHFLEHLPRDEGRAWLRDCYRVLMPGGTLRIAMPSLRHIVAKYCSEDWRDQDWLRLPEFAHVQTRAHMINLAFREWGHQWLYDDEELRCALVDGGFADVQFCPRNESLDPLLRGRETRTESLLVCEARR